MKIDQFKNLLAFLFLVTGEDCKYLPAPDYIIEKFTRYSGVGMLRDDDAWKAGLHPHLRAQFNAYLEHWHLHIEEMAEQEVAQ
jgi:hypothetical protein